MQNNMINLKKIDELLNLEGKNKKKIIDVKLTTQKKNRITENNKQEALLGTLVEKYNKRIDKINRESVKNKNKKLEANYHKTERIQQRLQNHITLESIKNREKLQIINDKHIKSQNLLTEREKLRLTEKKKTDIERYYNKVEYQNITLLKNQQLIDKCIEKETLDDFENSDQELFAEYEEEINDEPMEEITEEECSLYSDQSVVINYFMLT